jgi:hypothetical protein
MNIKPTVVLKPYFDELIFEIKLEFFKTYSDRAGVERRKIIPVKEFDFARHIGIHVSCNLYYQEDGFDRSKTVNELFNKEIDILVGYIKKAAKEKFVDIDDVEISVVNVIPFHSSQPRPGSQFLE